MERHSTQPLPWFDVGLATLPGLFVLATAWNNSTDEIISVTGMAVLVLIALAGVLSKRTLPVWSYATWGLLVGRLLFTPLLFVVLPLVILAWIYAGRRLVEHGKDGTLPLKVWFLLALLGAASILLPLFMVLLPRLLPAGVLMLIALPITTWLALAWLPFALQAGMRASPFVLGVGLVVWAENTDFDYFISLSSWDTLMTAIWSILLLVVAPVCVLRLRSFAGQLLSVLLLVALAFFSVITLSALARHQPSLLLNPPVNLYSWVPGANGINGIGLREPSRLLPAVWRQIPSAVSELLNLLLVMLLYRWLGPNDQERRPSIGHPPEVSTPSPITSSRLPNLRSKTSTDAAVS